MPDPPYRDHLTLEELRARRSGVVVNVTWSATLAPMPMVAVYTASKMAIEGFTASLAFELARAIPAPVR